MGRPAKGVQTVYEVKRLELSYLLRHKYIEKGCIKQGVLYWTTGDLDAGSICLLTSYLGGEENYIQLSYSLTKGGQRVHLDYKIRFEELASNLGKGSVLFLICPSTGRRCRILYMAYGSDTFKSRYAYKHRLYYDSQISTKLWKYCDYYWRLDTKLERLEKITGKGNRTYNGALTKAAQRYNRYRAKWFNMDALRWTAGMPKVLQRKLDTKIPNV